MKCFTHSVLTFAAAIVAGLAVGGGTARAVVLFSDTFDRGNNRDIDAEITGITNATGTAFGASAVYSQPWLDPNNAAPTFGVQDADAANGGGAQIINNTLQLAVGQGTSNAFVNHNFTNASILSSGAFKVTLEITSGYAGTSNQQGGAFAIGMSQAEALSGGDAFNNSPTPKFTHAFPNGTPNVVSDFWVGLRGNGTLAWGNGSISPGDPGYNVASVGSKTGTISANFGVTSFNAGSQVNYEVFFNGVSQGVGSFLWSGTNENYLGIDARDGTGVNFNSFTVETSTPPATPTLTVNRDTGNITLVNTTNQPLAMTIYSITTASGGLDQSNWNTIEEQNLDLDDTWFTLTNPSSTTDISEATLGSYTLAANNPGTTDQINLGNAWMPSPFEDLDIEVRNTLGNVVPIKIEYVGNSGEPIGLADYNHNGTVDGADWALVRGNLISDVSSLSAFQRYLEGDLNNDGFVNSSDFRLFKSLYEADNGLGSFAALALVPEPTSLLLVCGGVLITLMRRRVNAQAVAVLMVACMLVTSTNSANAANLFSDTFDRADSRNIDAVLSGITNGTGSSLPADGVYSHPFIDPNNAPPTYGAQDADALNGGGAQILTNQLQLAVGQGTSNVYINHNFTNSSQFSVSVQVLGYAGASTGQGGAFAIGMSQAEASTTGDAFGGHPLGSTTFGPKMQDAFENSGTASEGTVVSDFWVALTGSNNLIWGGFGDENVHATVNVGAKTGTIKATFKSASGFTGGSSVAYEVFFNDVSQGFGVFNWTEDMANYIGLDSRDGTAVQFDNLAIESITNAAVKTLRLQVNTDSGAVSIAGGDIAATLDFYEIRSAGAGLVAGSFDGLRGAAGFPAGNGSGNGWELNGVLTSGSLSESYLQDSSTFAASGAPISLGSIYNTSLDTQDLQFFYEAPDGTRRMGFIEYVTGGGTAGDFDNDGDVDGRDFLVWQRNPSVGSLADWKANYGAGALASVAAVPEPSTLLMGLSTLAIVLSGRRIKSPVRILK